MSELDIIEGWSIKDNGPGFYATDEHDRVSVWIDGMFLHHEASHGQDQCDIPLVVIDRLRELSR